MREAVILAGGLATRLRPITETCPKVLLDINGEPFIAHQLRLLRQADIRRVVLCLGYLGERVQDFVGDGSTFDMEVAYAYDGPVLLGTAGAIKKVLPLLDEYFFVIYGDSYLLCDYQKVAEVFLQSKKKALMTVFENRGQWDRSNVEFEHGQIRVYDKQQQTAKMHHIDYGLGVFSRDAFAKVPLDQPYDLATVYQQLLQDGQLAGYEVSNRFYEIGSFAGVEELKQLLK